MGYHIPSPTHRSAIYQQEVTYESVPGGRPWMKKRMDMYRETNYYMPYSEKLNSCQEYKIWHQRKVMWEQGPIRALVSITLQKILSPPSARGAQNTNFGRLAAIS